MYFSKKYEKGILHNSFYKINKPKPDNNYYNKNLDQYPLRLIIMINKILTKPNPST